MTPNVNSVNPNATPAGSNWNLPATRVSGTSSAPSASPSAGSATPQDTIEIGKNAADAAAGANGSNATTLPSLAVITQRIISEIRQEAKTEQKKTDQRRAQDESDRRDAEVRQREQQAEERKQLAQKLDAARRDPTPQPPPQPQPKPAPPQKSDSTPAVPEARPGDPSNPSILHAQEIQAQGIKLVSRTAPASAPDPTPAPAPSTPVVSASKSASPVSAPPPPSPPSRDASELLHTITSQLNTSSLYEMSSVHLLSVNFQS